VELYTTDSCSFCRRAKGLLQAKGVAFREVFLPRDDLDAHVCLSRRTGMATMPQILVDGRLLGGWEELSRLEAAGLLDAVLGGAAAG
jgi:glutaredoxin 3